MRQFFKDKKLVVRRLLFILIDILCINLASLFALTIRFYLDLGEIPMEFVDSILIYAPIHTAITLVLFWIFRLYHSLWIYASIAEGMNIVLAGVSAGVVQYIGMKLMALPIPRSYFVLSTISLIAFVGFTRFSYRFVRMINRDNGNKNERKNVMIVGAGDAGMILLKEIKNSQHINMEVKCFVDDDKAKWGRYIQGVRVVGNRDTIPQCVSKYSIDQIMIAIPSHTAAELKPILHICKETGCELKILPGVYQLVNNEVSVSRLRDVEIEDLLGREPIRVDIQGIMGYVTGKTVMVTGGGGSIGSELCRQIASHNPKTLVIVDIYENNAYDIQQELIRQYPKLDLQVQIASVRDTNRMDDIMCRFHPNIVYHAAAHKHVPLMEDSPNEAIKNNVFGTYKTVKAADKWGVERFVLISTDKAVNPTNIMGASKRMCEMIVQSYNRHSKTDYVAVRFGNVLGSNGSVIPLFKKQIAEGGPVTVTHPDIIRYFMTIPEAVSLVLQAGAYAQGGEIFVLDMGDPVKILDLAKNLIRLSGYTPDEDIKIEFTGLRPGEKLYEELLMDEEGLQETPNKMIHIGKPIEFDEAQFYRDLEQLAVEAKHETTQMKRLVQKIVPTYIIKENKSRMEQSFRQEQELTQEQKLSEENSMFGTQMDDVVLAGQKG
jgi:FlaA1/EpsC-like NDP-sugar epimerase